MSDPNINRQLYLYAQSFSELATAKDQMLSQLYSYASEFAHLVESHRSEELNRLEAWLILLDARSGESVGHCLRVGRYASIIGEEYGLDKDINSSISSRMMVSLYAWEQR